MKGIDNLYKLRNYVSRNTLKMVYHAFIPPHIDYGLIVSGSATKSNLKIIQDKMKKTIRTIFFQKKSNRPTEPLFQEHQILNFENQKNLHCMLYVEIK